MFVGMLCGGGYHCTSGEYINHVIGLCLITPSSNIFVAGLVVSLSDGAQQMVREGTFFHTSFYGHHPHPSQAF